MSDFRDKLAADLEHQYDKLLTVLKAAVDAEKKYTVTCPRKCCNGNSFNAPFPDVRAMLDAAKFWTDQGLGKPKEHAKPDLDLTKLPENMTTAQRVALMERAEKALAGLEGKRVCRKKKGKVAMTEIYDVPPDPSPEARTPQPR